ncbi:hypothetical protein ACQ4M4_10055 [Leptolyngbya sp. AN02str]|uniref:hypothetical protein n=1 Tax=Leptolyngbya sp. AN02str TaxID=3423363 RepID=UPI003D310204
MMRFVIKRWMPLSLICSGLVLGGCSQVQSPSNAPAVSPSPSVSAASTPSDEDASPWVAIAPGEMAYSLTFTQDGQLQMGDAADTVLLEEIPVSYSSDNTVSYAQQLIVSPPSPSAQYQIVKACDSAGLCWAVYEIDRNAQTAQQVAIAKYGGLEWVQWSADERYALFVESMEGSTWMVALDLETGRTALSDEIPMTVDVNSFEWTGDRAFQINARECTDAACTEEAFTYRNNIDELFAN